MRDHRGHHHADKQLHANGMQCAHQVGIVQTPLKSCCFCFTVGGVEASVVRLKSVDLIQIIVRTILFFLNDSIKIDKVFDNKKLLEAGFKTKLKFDVELDKFLKNVI